MKKDNTENNIIVRTITINTLIVILFLPIFTLSATGLLGILYFLIFTIYIVIHYILIRIIIKYIKEYILCISFIAMNINLLFFNFLSKKDVNFYDYIILNFRGIDYMNNGTFHKSGDILFIISFSIFLSHYIFNY